MTSADNTVTVDIQDGMAVITIDRPEVRNAINASVLGRISRALDELADNDDAQIVIFTGAGDKAFVAGADINELAVRKPKDGLRAAMQGVYEKVEQFHKPTIAAVNGYAFGGGHELALACDIRIASANAQFALPETSLGIMPAAGGTQRLARLVGVGRATEMILTSRNAAVPMMGGVMEPPEDAVASTAPATLALNPDFFMAGMVMGPVVNTLDTAEPLIMPMAAELATETLAEPPR